MKHTVQNKFKQLNHIIQKLPEIAERAVAGILAIAIIYCCFRFFMTVISFEEPLSGSYLQEMLKYAFNIVIALEFVRMLVKHSMKTVVEVLIYALARGLIVETDTPTQILVRIVCIAILLLCRKYLFHTFDFSEVKAKLHIAEKADSAEQTK
ncbi:MAG: phosphate-starvation-inducible PsiE family protein [Acetatifactor sp.]|nr:phosphate-starvation-inducible PsiE family protein [Acetatifactor sp.]